MSVLIIRETDDSPPTPSQLETVFPNVNISINQPGEGIMLYKCGHKSIPVDADSAFIVGECQAEDLVAAYGERILKIPQENAPEMIAETLHGVVSTGEEESMEDKMAG